MYGDTTVIRRLARQLDEQAHDIRHEADRLVALADACPWSGWAADAMRRRARDRATALRRSAGRHHDAAERLTHHAAEVERVKGLIAGAERRISRLLDDLVDLVDRFTPPPPGHRDWLRVEIPGVPL